MSDPEHVTATRDAYDTAAESYLDLVGTEISASIEGPLDRAVIDAFVGHLADAPDGPVVDLGCGPGRVAALLASRGVEVYGLDVSPQMVGIARTAHPHIRFDEGRLTDLPVADGTLAGVVCWYSIIHTPPQHLDEVGAELVRAIVPGGWLLLAFQAGDGEAVRRVEAYGHEISLTSYRHSLDAVASCLVEAGLVVHGRALREAEQPDESTPQAFLIARRPRV